MQSIARAMDLSWSIADLTITVSGSMSKPESCWFTAVSHRRSFARRASTNAFG